MRGWDSLSVARHRIRRSARIDCLNALGDNARWVGRFHRMCHAVGTPPPAGGQSARMAHLSKA